uniref:Arylamine N-acetyltransferase 6 n=1 Tax=Dictyostelium discoideum TaxID=44689 RepID=D8FSX1_DICDI|nr:TPA: arylamine N-acetyltransferase 6 [Dictyostelium discoideum]
MDKIKNNNESNNFKYCKDYNIKELLLKRLKLDINTKIQTLDDISKILIVFSRKIPFDSSDLLLNGFKPPFSVENIIKRVLIDKFGSYCINLNILFGLFLCEMGIDVKLIKGIEGSTLFQNPWFQKHHSNIINWENKLYYLDVGFGCITPFKPLELLNEETIKNYNENENKNEITNTVYRVRKLKNDDDNDEYLYEEKIIDKTKPQNQLFSPVFHFNLSPATYEIIEYSIEQYSKFDVDKMDKIKNNNESNNFKYCKDYNIKELLLKRLKLDINTKIQTLDDISKIHIVFSRKIPFDNSDLLINGFKPPFSVENIIKRVLIDKFGNYCTNLNILFGLFLCEMGIDVRLIKGIEGSTLLKSPWFHNHFSNIIYWENKLYYLDVGFGCITPFKPLELLNEETIKNYNENENKNEINKTVYRVRKLKNDDDDDEYLYEEKFIDKIKPQNPLFSPVFHFNLSPVTYEIIEYRVEPYSKFDVDKEVTIYLKIN